MSPKARSRSLRGILVAAVLLVAVAGGALDKGRGVSAKSCEQAFTDYLNASFAYETARINFFYSQPLSCEKQCQGSFSKQQCIEDCRMRLQTSLGAAEMSMFSNALDTCTPSAPNECAMAQTMANSCLSQYDAASYSNPDEAAAVDAQYWACIQASKVDSCR